MGGGANSFRGKLVGFSIDDDNNHLVTPFPSHPFPARRRATGTRGFGLANARRIRTIFSTFQGLPRFRAATVGLTAETISGVAMGCRLLGVVEYQEGVGGPDGLDRNDTVSSLWLFFFLLFFCLFVLYVFVLFSSLMLTRRP